MKKKNATNAKADARAVIRYNKEKNGIELILPDGRKLNQTELLTLKSLGFCWHKMQKYWYTRYSDEKMEVIRTSFLGREAQFPAVSETKLMKQMAAEKAAAAAKKAETKKTATPKKATAAAAADERLASLEQQMAQMAEALTALTQLLTK